ncbi:glycerol kinase [Breznakia sp. PF5-3]|uniref:glycerol kinase GlpK n=1 Tax=unclassified Breznakia TaxID=2623764 RepID=UPI002405B5CC|nr:MULTISPECIES: glycerol kinase GlpK [unclassified Breznakia]MDF9824752.1 glycerol kinase [Breznakia sp. PM6-1]MDF9835681.1 glycerol kinase [Breznakia sp. PF5-3]MDF9837730.1 glycerol kinase [Breznakia sp. PFB2-8]MDF9859691.1 glycerol kinase [Breznakia sp. PH5-24]
MGKYILSLDLGTTSIRAVLFDKHSNICAMEQKEFTQYFEHPGWVEQDAEEIWQTLQILLAGLLVNQKIDFDEVEAIGITNQRETTIIWDKQTGLPIYRAIVWQSTQTNEICEALIEQGHTEFIKHKTGLPINSYFSATKIRWILDRVPEAQKRAEAGDLLFGTVDSWILWKLSNGVHATDYSNASRTMLYNIFSLEWDGEILSLLNIPRKLLPEVKDSSGYFATTSKTQFFNYEIPIMAIAGDQQASLFGHGCYEPGIVKNTYGTGCFMLMNTLDKPIISKNGLLTTIAWGIDGSIEYAIEGSIFVAGSAVQWLRDSLKLIDTAAESEQQALSLNDNQGVYLVPAFVGLGSPYWDSEAKGSIFGLTRGSGREAIVRATLESICYQTKDVLDVMVEECNCDLKMLRVDGGAVENAFLMQFQADILGVEIDVAHVSETTALGVAYLAGLSSGFWTTKTEILQYRQIKKHYSAKMSKEKQNQYYEKWKKAVAATKMFK